MLRGDNIDKAQTLQDDMESLLYVILYCALRWLPHHYPDWQLSALLDKFFNEQMKMFGVLEGGYAKSANAENRGTTDAIEFSNEAFSDWLNTALDFHSLRRAVLSSKHEDRHKDRWSDPNHLYTFWTSFLESRDLPNDDRHEHILDPRHFELPPYTGPTIYLPGVQPPSAREVGHMDQPSERRGSSRGRAVPVRHRDVEGVRDGVAGPVGERSEEASEGQRKKSDAHKGRSRKRQTSSSPAATRAAVQKKIALQLPPSQLDEEQRGRLRGKQKSQPPPQNLRRSSRIRARTERRQG